MKSYANEDEKIRTYFVMVCQKFDNAKSLSKAKATMGPLE